VLANEEESIYEYSIGVNLGPAFLCSRPIAAGNVSLILSSQRHSLPTHLKLIDRGLIERREVTA
jgi:hypothetical protein